MLTSPVELPGPAGDIEQVRINEYWQHQATMCSASPQSRSECTASPAWWSQPASLDQVARQLQDRLDLDVATAHDIGLTMAAQAGEQAASAAGWVPAIAGTVDGAAHRTS